MFDVLNNWNSGYVNWSISDPNIINSTYLNNNQSIMVFIENNYTSQGIKLPLINATTSRYVDRLNDYFFVKPIEINSLQTLSEGSTGTFEVEVSNNLEIQRNISLRLDTGTTNITSNIISLNASESIFAYIQSNYSSSNIYRTIAYTNTSNYNDTEYGVIIT